MEFVRKYFWWLILGGVALAAYYCYQNGIINPPASTKVKPGPERLPGGA